MKLCLLPILLVCLCAPSAAQVFSPAGQEALPRVDAVLVARAETDKPAWTGMLLHLKPLLRAEATKLAIVVPLPAEATSFAITDRKGIDASQQMHANLLSLAREQWEAKTDFTLPDWLGWMTRREPPLSPEPLPDVIPERGVGAVNFTPIRGNGAEAEAAVRAWLSQRGFPSDGKLATWPGETGSFLCVLVEADGRGSIPLRPELPVLAISYEGEAAFPLVAFPMADGALDLTVVSDFPVEDKSIHDARVAMSTRILGYVNLVNLYSVKSLPEVISAAAGKRAGENPPERWFLNRLESVKVAPRDGAETAPVAFKPGNQTDELPGFWYYGDREISFFERFFRQHAMAFMFSMGAGGFVLLLIKTRQNRRRMEAEAREKKVAG